MLMQFGDCMLKFISMQQTFLTYLPQKTFLTFACCILVYRHTLTSSRKSKLLILDSFLHMLDSFYFKQLSIYFISAHNCSQEGRHRSGEDPTHRVLLCWRIGWIREMAECRQSVLVFSLSLLNLLNKMLVIENI